MILGRLLAAVSLFAVAGSSWGQVRTWQIGDGGLSWSSQSGIVAAVDLRRNEYIQASGFSAGDNIAEVLQWQDGAPNDFRLEGQPRVWDNAAVTASNLSIVDGDSTTSTGERFKGPGVDQTGRIFYFDLGASYPADGVVFYPSREGQADFVRAFEISVNDGVHFSREGKPVFEVLQRVDINTRPRVELGFPHRLLRFVKLRIMSPNPFELAELEVLGQGYVPKARYTSKLIDFGGPVNLGTLSLEAEKAGEAAVPASAALTVRNGTDDTPLVYYRVDIESQAEIEVTAEEYSGLGATEKGPVRYDAGHWSAWSRPLEMAADGRYGLDLGTLPGPRRFFQFGVEFMGSSTTVMRIRRLAFTSSAPLAQRGLLEVALRDDPQPADGVATAVTGVPTAFLCGVRSEFGTASYQGFDGIHIATPDTPIFLGLRMGDVDNEVTPDSVRTDTSGLWVYFPTHRVTPMADTAVWLVLETTPLLYNTLFRGWLLDTEGSLAQPLEAGNAGPEIGTGSANVYGTFGDPLERFELSTKVVTPNRDGSNDAVEMHYTLVHLVEGGRVELGIYDLAGRLVSQVADEQAVAGRHTGSWSGRDRGGHLVPPGHYLCRMALRTQSETSTWVEPLAVAY